MDTNTAGVLALAIMGGALVAIVWLICWVRIRIHRNELEYDRKNKHDELEYWPDGTPVRRPNDRSVER